MRAVAVLAVVVVHAGASGVPVVDRVVSHLNIGVAIFFLISGFLLYRPFIAHRTGGASAPPVAQYAKRRFLRIYPAYWLALTVLTVVLGLEGTFGPDWWAFYGLLHTLPVYSDCVGGLGCGLSQTWSLVIELSFYAALPLYALAAAGLARGRRVGQWLPLELALLAALGAASVVARFVVLHAPLNSWVGGTLLGSFLWFALGMGLAVISVAIEGDEAKPAPIRFVAEHPVVPWAAAIACYVALCVWLPPTSFIFSEGKQLVIHLAFGLIAALLLLPAAFGYRAGGLPRRFLAAPLVAWLGLISYGIFLWHLPISIQLQADGAGYPVRLLGTLAITIPCAAASYYLLERPVLRLKYRRLLPRRAPRARADADAAA